METSFLSLRWVVFATLFMGQSTSYGLGTLGSEQWVSQLFCEVRTSMRPTEQDAIGSEILTFDSEPNGSPGNFVGTGLLDSHNELINPGLELFESNLASHHNASFFFT